MTLRLTEEQDRALERLAAAEGVGKGEAAIKAILEKAARLDRTAAIDDAIDDLLARYPKTLRRLGE